MKGYFGFHICIYERAQHRRPPALDGNTISFPTNPHSPNADKKLKLLQFESLALVARSSPGGPT